MKALCPYKHLLGKPGTGIHSYRLFNIAIIDVFVVLIFAHFLCILFPRVPKYIFYIGIFVVGILVHRLFCVRTTIDKWLFPHVSE